MAEIRVVAAGFERVEGVDVDVLLKFLGRRLTAILVDALATPRQPISVTVTAEPRLHGEPVILVYHPPGLGDDARFEHVADLARSRLRSLDALALSPPGVEFILDNGAGCNGGPQRSG